MDKATLQSVLGDVRSALLCGFVAVLVTIGWSTRPHLAPRAPRAPRAPEAEPELATRAPGSREFLLDEADRLLLEDHGDLHHDFVRGIRAAEARGWFAPSEQTEFELAQQALVQLRAHVARMEGDREFRCGMNLLGNLALREEYLDADMVWYWASPFLVCCPRIRGDSPFDALEPRDREQRDRREAARNAAVERAAWRGRIAQALYRQFLADWQEPLSLRPLMDPYGGRADYPQNVRSYREGYPMAILCFGMEGSIALPKHLFPVRELYGSRRSEEIVDRPSGDLYCFEHGEEDPLADARFAAQSVVPLLAFTFARQKRNWGLPNPRADTLLRGLPVLYRIASIDEGVPSFVPIGESSTDPLEMASLAATREAKSANSPGRMSLEDLAALNARGDSRYEPRTSSESRAWVLFFMHGEEGLHRPAFAQALDGTLQRDRDEESGLPVLRYAFGLDSPARWQELETAFDAFLDERLGTAAGN